MNIDCYRYHLTSGFCSKSKQCQACGEIWDVADNTQRGRAGHVCMEKFCHTCKNYHIPKRGCFIEPVEQVKEKPYRIVAFDFETTQCDKYMDFNAPPNGKIIHKVNKIILKFIKLLNQKN